MGIEAYSPTPATNATAGSVNFANGQAAASVNDSARQVMADVRSLVNDRPWFQYGMGDQGSGNAGVPAVYVSGTSFSISGADVTGKYAKNARIRAAGTTTGTIYGSVASSSYSTGVTTVVAVWDQSAWALVNESLTVSISGNINNSLPANFVDMSWWGNDHIAFRKAINMALQYVGSFSSPFLQYSAPLILIPPGICSITDYITPDTAQALNALTFQGQNSILDLGSDVVGFGGIGYNATFRNLTTRGGACPFSIKTNNADTTAIRFEGVRTINPTVANYRTDNNSNSSKISFDDACLHYNSNTGAIIFQALTGDQIIIRGWMETACDVSIDIGDAVVFLENILGVPLNGNGAWAQITGDYIGTTGVGSFFSHKNRYGAEGNGKTVLNVTTTSAPGYIVFRDDQIFCAGNPWLTLGAWPKYRLTAKGLNAPENTTGIKFADSFNDAQKANLFSYGTGRVEVEPQMAAALSGDNGEAGAMLFPQVARDITPDNLLLSIPISESSAYGFSSSGSQNVSLTNSTDQFGNFAYIVEGTGSGNDGIAIFNYSTALNGLTQGPTTVYFDFENLTSPFVQGVYATAGYVNVQIPTGGGKHFHHVHGYYDGVTQKVSIEFYNIKLGTQFRISGIRIIAGHVVPPEDGRSWLTMTANAFPVSAGYYFKGDFVANIPMTSGQPVGWGCTAAGSSGTWKSAGSFA